MLLYPSVHIVLFSVICQCENNREVLQCSVVTKLMASYQSHNKYYHIVAMIRIEIGCHDSDRNRLP